MLILLCFHRNKFACSKMRKQSADAESNCENAIRRFPGFHEEKMSQEISNVSSPSHFLKYTKQEMENKTFGIKKRESFRFLEPSLDSVRRIKIHTHVCRRRHQWGTEITWHSVLWAWDCAYLPLPPSTYISTCMLMFIEKKVVKSKQNSFAFAHIPFSTFFFVFFPFSPTADGKIFHLFTLNVDRTSKKFSTNTLFHFFSSTSSLQHYRTWHEHMSNWQRIGWQTELNTRIFV